MAGYYSHRMFFFLNNVETTTFSDIYCEIIRGNMQKAVFVSPASHLKFRSAAPDNNVRIKFLGGWGIINKN